MEIFRVKPAAVIFQVLTDTVDDKAFAFFLVDIVFSREGVFRDFLEEFTLELREEIRVTPVFRFVEPQCQAKLCGFRLRPGTGRNSA